MDIVSCLSEGATMSTLRIHLFSTTSSCSDAEWTMQWRSSAFRSTMQPDRDSVSSTGNSTPAGTRKKKSASSTIEVARWKLGSSTSYVFRVD